MGYRPTISLYVENELVDIRMYKDYNNRALFLFAIEDAINFNECTTLDEFYKKNPENRDRDKQDDLDFENNNSEYPIIVDITNKTIYSKDEKLTDKSKYTILDQINYPLLCEYYGLTAFKNTLELIERENGLLSDWKIENSLFYELIPMNENDISAKEEYKVNVIIDNKYLYDAFKPLLDHEMRGRCDNYIKTDTDIKKGIYITGKLNKLIFPSNLYQLPYMLYKMMEEFILLNMDGSEIEKKGEETLKELRTYLYDNREKIMTAYKYVRWEFNGNLFVRRYDRWIEEHSIIEYPVHKLLSYDDYTGVLKTEDSSVQPPVFKNYDCIKIEDYMDRLKDRSDTEIQIINEFKIMKTADEELEKRFPEYYQREEIRNLELPLRELNCLLRYGLRYVGEVEELSDTDICNIRNMSLRSPKIIRESIEELKNSYISGYISEEDLEIDDELM